MKIMNNLAHAKIMDELEDLREENDYLKTELDQYKANDEVTEAKRIANVLQASGLKQHSTKYQEIMERVVLELLGRDSEMLKAYSKTAFLKDNPEEIIQRAIELQQQSSALTKRSIENKKK